MPDPLSDIPGLDLDDLVDLNDVCRGLTEEDWGETADRFATRPEADRRLAEVEATGRLGRLIRWQGNQCMKVTRVNDTK